MGERAVTDMTWQELSDCSESDHLWKGVRTCSNASPHVQSSIIPHIFCHPSSQSHSWAGNAPATARSESELGDSQACAHCWGTRSAGLNELRAVRVPTPD
eukprot:366464-Chlamydomonas_euryale.AAC.13